jgi:hypothetical protein
MATTCDGFVVDSKFKTARESDMRPFHGISKNLGMLGLCGICGLAGCRTYDKQVCHPQMYRLPPGVTAGAHFETQASNALASRFVIYRHEWLANVSEAGYREEPRILGNARPEDLTRLTRSGVQHIQIMASNLTPSWNDELDEQRRQVVTEQLLSLLPEGANVNVIVAQPNEEGMRGKEAIQTFNDLESGTGGGMMGRSGFFGAAGGALGVSGIGGGWW